MRLLLRFYGSDIRNVHTQSDRAALSTLSHRNLNATPLDTGKCKISRIFKSLFESHSSSSSKNKTLSIPVKNTISSDGRFYVAGVYVDDDENFCSVIESDDSYNALVKAKHIPDLEKGIVSTFEKMMKM